MAHPLHSLLSTLPMSDVVRSCCADCNQQHVRSAGPSSPVSRKRGCPGGPGAAPGGGQAAGHAQVEPATQGQAVRVKWSSLFCLLVN
jgi:hypothetical protein